MCSSVVILEVFNKLESVLLYSFACWINFSFKISRTLFSGFLSEWIISLFESVLLYLFGVQYISAAAVLKLRVFSKVSNIIS